jgi:PAS domain S-box-containing protein
VLESSSDCIKVLDLDGYLQMMSEGGQRALGVTDISHLLGKCWIDFWQGKDREAAVVAVDNARRGQVGAFEGYCPTLTGEGRWWSLVLSPMLGSDGLPEKIVCVSRDITARRQTEELIHESESRLRALVTASSDVLYRMSPDFKEMRQLDGRGFLSDTDSVSTRWIEEYIDPEDQPHVMVTIQEAVRTKSMFEMEHRVLRADGALGWTLSRAIPLLDAQGEITEWFGAASDVTARKQAEEALSASEAKYRSLFESMDEGFCIVEVLLDQDGRPCDYRFLEANPAFERHTRLVSVKGRTMRDLVPDYEPHWFERYGAVALTGEPSRFADQAEGLGRFYDVYAFRIGAPENRHVAVLFNDITERKRMELALAASEERLQQVFAQAPVAVAVLRGRELVFELANSFYHELVPGRELLGRPFLTAIPEISPKIVTILHRVLAGCGKWRVLS